jgi:uncharacterized membrane protein
VLAAELTGVGAILAAIGAVTSAVVGLVLVVRNLRSKSRRAALDEADELEAELATCRRALHVAGSRQFVLEQHLVENGLEVPP